MTTCFIPEFITILLHIAQQQLFCTSSPVSASNPTRYRVAPIISLLDADIIASGGIGNIEHIKSLADTGVEGVIVGRALYTGNVDLKDAIEAVK